MPLNDFFSDCEVISKYSLEDALADDVLVRTGYLEKSKIPVVFTTNLFGEVKDHYKDIIHKGLEMLSQKDFEDTPSMRLRVIEKDRVWVVANPEAITFMKPEDY